MPGEQFDPNKLWAFLEGIGAYARQETRDEIAEHVCTSASVAPSPIALRLPAATRDFFIFAMTRSLLLGPQIRHAAEVGCHVEAVVLAHGAALLAVRGLHVVWLQSQSAQPLDEKELRPYYEPESRKGLLHTLTPRLQRVGLLSEAEANDLRWLNGHRNKVVHGAIFGELEIPSLPATTAQAAEASLTAVLATLRWLQQSARSVSGTAQEIP